jgi:hypothetical protein
VSGILYYNVEVRSLSTLLPSVLLQCFLVGALGLFVARRPAVVTWHTLLTLSPPLPLPLCESSTQSFAKSVKPRALTPTPPSSSQALRSGATSRRHCPPALSACSGILAHGCSVRGCAPLPRDAYVDRALAWAVCGGPQHGQQLRRANARMDSALIQTAVYALLPVTVDLLDVEWDESRGGLRGLTVCAPVAQSSADDAGGLSSLAGGWGKRTPVRACRAVPQNNFLSCTRRRRASALTAVDELHE